MAKKPATLPFKPGDPAPPFALDSNGGTRVSLSDFKGRRVVLYFYPKDDTPGCTKEACGFRDQHAAITGLNAVVLGVSPDAVKSHDKFVDKFQLPFALLADVDKKVVQAYGVWGEKSFMGRKYMGVFRVTVLVDEKGRVARIWDEVKPEQHAAEVIAALKELPKV